MGSVTTGAYVCQLTIVAPKLTLHAGAPAPYGPPAPGQHGTAPQQAVLPSLLRADELSQRGYEEPTNPVDPRRLMLWKSYLERRGIKFEIGTPVAELKLFDTNSVGLYALHTRTIYLLHPPNVAAFFEEAFHALQHLRNHPRKKVLETGQDVDAWEYDAKKALLAHAAKLGLSYEGYIETEKQLKEVVNNEYGDDY